MRTRPTTPGPNGREAAMIMATLFRDPLEVHVRLAARYGDAVRMAISPSRSSFLFSRPEHAEHVFAVNQDNYVKAAGGRSGACFDSRAVPAGADHAGIPAPIANVTLRPGHDLPMRLLRR